MWECYSRTTTKIHKLLSYATKADLWPEQQPNDTLTCEKCGARVRGERGLKTHFQQWCGQSAREAQTASGLEANTRMQGFERINKWPCPCCQKEFSTRSNRIVHERRACRDRPPQPQESAQAPTTSASIVSDHRVSAPARTNDSVIAATSAQLQIDGKREDGDKLEHGCKPAVETQRDPKRLRQSNLRDFWRGKEDLRLWW